MKKAGKKRKQFETKESASFKAVEEEELRCKYSTVEILALIQWMYTNIYRRQSPNKKDTVRKRDINSEMYCMQCHFYTKYH